MITHIIIYTLDCDASDTDVAGELGQVVDGKVQVIAYGSFTMTPEQQRYSTTCKELLPLSPGQTIPCPDRPQQLDLADEV